MAQFHYRIVPHDGGWAYTLDHVFSESFPSRAAAMAAVRRVIVEQHTPGDATVIQYQDAEGAWHTEESEGTDRPDIDLA